MKYITSYKIFESNSSLEHLFGIKEDELMDIFQDILDLYPLTTEIQVYEKGSDSLCPELDFFVLLIKSEEVIDDRVFIDYISEIDSKLGIYNLEIFYASPLSDRSIGENFFIKRKGDISRMNKKTPGIILNKDKVW